MKILLNETNNRHIFIDEDKDKSFFILQQPELIRNHFNLSKTLNILNCFKILSLLTNLMPVVSFYSLQNRSAPFSMIVKQFIRSYPSTLEI